MTTPFDAPSTLPYGMPPFAEIRAEHYAPALEAGMAQQLAEIAAIAGNAEPPTFENTMVALERSGQLLDRVERVFFSTAAADGDETTEALEEEFAPKLAAHSDAIRLDARLFARIDDLFQRRDALDLDPH